MPLYSVCQTLPKEMDDGKESQLKSNLFDSYTILSWIDTSYRIKTRHFINCDKYFLRKVTLFFSFIGNNKKKAIITVSSF